MRLRCVVQILICIAFFGLDRHPAASLAAEAPPLPASSESKVYEDFESYRGVLPFTPWPMIGGFMPGPYGFYADYKLDRIVKGGGSHSLQMTYRIGPMDQMTLSRLYEPALDWSRFDAIRFWLKPDGSGRRVTFFVLESIGPDHKKWFWEAGYDMNGTEPVIVTMPFSAFHQTSSTPDPNKKFDWRSIYETAFWVRAADSTAPTVFSREAWPPRQASYGNTKQGRLGTGPHNPQVPSTIWLDDFEVIKLRDRLDRVVAVPAPQGLSPPAVEDGVLRVDFGSEADWIDQRRRLWRADVPASQGVLFTAPDAPVVDTEVPDLHRNQRHGITRLKFHVPAQRYDVTLHFCELDARVTGPGQRAFSVAIGTSFRSTVDVWRQAGGSHIALTLAASVDAVDGVLPLTFTPKGKTPAILSAIEIAPARSAAAAVEPPPAPADDDFERYASNAELTAVWQGDGQGVAPALSLERSTRGRGDKGLRFDYVLGARGRSGLSMRVPAGRTRLRLWVKSDDSGNSLEFGPLHGRAVLRVPLKGAAARFVEVPLPRGADKLTHSLRVARTRGGRPHGTLFLDEIAFLPDPGAAAADASH